MRRLLLFVIGCLFSFGLAVPSLQVHACGGGADDNIQSLLERTDYVVKADVISVDEVRQNAIVSVDTYLYGGAGPEYLVFLQTDPVIVTRMTEGDPYGACNFFQPELHPGLSAYFFLRHRPDGVYLTATQWNDPNHYAFPDADTTITLYSQGEDGYVEHVLNEDDFVAFVTEFGDSEVQPPAEDLPFPRLAPLKLTTDAGTDFVLPVDSDRPIQVTDEFLREMTIAVMFYDSTGWYERYFGASDCPGEGCVQVSPDGINRAEQRGGEVRWFGGSARGRAFQFSATGDAIAIWHENQIEFYTLGWQKRDQPFQEVTLLNSVTLITTETDDVPTQGAWTPDGRIFAYSDATGLWSLDVYNPSAQPMLLMETEDGAIPVALIYSSLGRYLQVQAGRDRFILDTVSDERHPDGLVSPDDQILLAFDTQADVFEPKICYLAPVRLCETIPSRVLYPSGGEPRAFTEYTQARWRNRFSFIVTICNRDDLEDCVINRFDNRGRHGQWYDGNHFPSEGEGIMFAYFAPNDTLAIVEDSAIVRVNGEAFDFTAVFDGDIVDLEWLPSLFYSSSFR